MSELPWQSKQPSITVEGDETLVDVFSTHWIKYVTPSALYLLIGGTAVSLLIVGANMRVSSPALSNGLLITGTVLLTIMHHWFFHRILSEGMADIIITNKRLIFLENTLWLSDNMHEVALALILAVKAQKQGIISNIFRFGTLWFDTGGTDARSSIIPLVPHPHGKAKIITQLLKLR